MKYFFYCFKHYADFSGRARRSEYWFFTLFALIIWVMIFAGLIAPLFSSAFLDDEFDPELMSATFLSNPFLYIALVFWIVMFIPTLAVQVRRLHDIGKSGYWLFLLYGVSFVTGLFQDSSAASMLASIVSLGVSILFLVWFFTNSQYGPNQYGLNPKGEGNPAEEDSPSEIPAE